MAKIAILYRNEVDFGTVAAEDALSTLPAAFLQSPPLSKVWRTPTSTTSSAVTVDLGTARAIRCVSLLACNLSATGTARVKLSNVSASGHELYDSTLIDPAGVDAAYRAFVHILPAAVTSRYARIELADGSLSYLEAGRIVVGALWVPEHNYDRNSIEKGAIDESQREVAISGEPWIDARPTRRRVRFALPRVSMAELALHLDAMASIAGRKRDVMVIVDPDATNRPQETYWGLMSEPPSAIHAGFRAWRQSIEVITR